MKICIDLTSLADNLSGIERYAACISLEMIKQFDEEYVLIFKKEISSLFSELCERENVETVVLRDCNKLLFNQVRLPLAISKIKADWFIFLAFPVPILIFKRNMVETIHDITCWDYPETMNGIMSFYFRLSHAVAIRKCKAIITISNYSRMRIQERLGYPENKTWLIYCGIDQERFVAKQNKYNEIIRKYHLPDRYILSLSTLEPRKNLKLLIEAYDSLINEGYDLPNLVLAGRKGWKMEELLNTVSEVTISNIYFTGFVADDDLPEIYAMAKLFVFPSMYEGFGIPPLEAMCCGTPVLSSNAASLPEVLEDAAIFFENNNLESLKRELIAGVNMGVFEKNKIISRGFNQSKKFKWHDEAQKLYLFLKRDMKLEYQEYNEVSR